MARDPLFLAWRAPRRWQVEALGAIVDSLRRGSTPLLAVTTGAGKTDLTCHAAYMAAIKSGDHHGSVILVPTESLVEQTYEALVKRATMCGARAPLFSAGRWYGKRKEAGADVVVCCYPSILSLAMEWAVTDRRPHLLIVDEAHGSEAPTVRQGIECLRPRRIAGLTATPYRADEAQSLGIFSEVAYQYSYHDAVRDGVLVPRRVLGPQFIAGRVELDDAILGMLREYAPRRDGRIWRSVVDADTIDDAERYAGWLTAKGVPSEAVHSQMDKEAVSAALGRLRDGAVSVLVHVNLLSEGVDLPWLRCYALRQGTASRNRLVQRVGRVLRVDPDDPDKAYGLILDPRDLCATVGLDHAPDVGRQVDEVQAVEEASRSIRSWEKVPKERREVWVQGARSEAVRWLALLRIELEERRIVPPPKVQPGRWRGEPASEKQVAALARMTLRVPLADETARDMVRALVADPNLTRGVAADLMDILRGVRSVAGYDRDTGRSSSLDVDTVAPEGAARVLDLARRAAERAEG